MTIQEAINEVDNLKPNMFKLTDKIKWLNRLDKRVYEEIICTHEIHEGEQAVEFTEYTADDTDKTLLVGEPYAEMYLRWMEAQIDYQNMEYDAFNNSNQVFESVYMSFRNAYNRSHMPKGMRKIYY